MAHSCYSMSRVICFRRCARDIFLGKVTPRPTLVRPARAQIGNASNPRRDETHLPADSARNECEIPSILRPSKSLDRRRHLSVSVQRTEHLVPCSVFIVIHSDWVPSSDFDPYHLQRALGCASGNEPPLTNARVKLGGLWPVSQNSTMGMPSLFLSVAGMLRSLMPESFGTRVA